MMSPRSKAELVLLVLNEAGEPLEALEIVRRARSRLSSSEFGAGAACSSLDFLSSVGAVERIGQKRISWKPLLSEVPEKKPVVEAVSPEDRGRLGRGYRGGTYLQERR